MRIGYARVSTGDQKLDGQLDALRAAGAERVYSEQVSSRIERPELVNALKALRQGDVLLVCKLDRLARSTKELWSILDQVQATGADLTVIQQPGLDTTAPLGKLLFTILGGVAEFERDLIRARTMDGLEAARRRGRHGGRKLKVTAALLRRIRLLLLHDPDLTVEEVARQEGISPATLYRHLPGGRAALASTDLGK